MRLRNSFWALLGQNVHSAPETVMERVRHVMLTAVDEYCGAHARSLDDKISYARDIDSLWYLRSDLMHAIANEHGETVARRCIEDISIAFRGYQPGSS